MERIESALDALLDGFVKQREQNGSGVAVDVAVHTLTAKTHTGVKLLYFEVCCAVKM